MFYNIGGKIKGLAKFITGIGIAISILGGIALLFFFPPIGILLMIVGSLASWISSFLLYGFGQLVENSDKLSEHFSNNEEEAASPEEKQYRCPKCSAMMEGKQNFCPHCGVKFTW